MIDSAFNFIYTIINNTVTWLSNTYINQTISILVLILGFYMFRALIKVFYVVR